MRRVSLCKLAADAELLDEAQIFLTILSGNVLEQALALTDSLQQAAACHKIVLVLLEVLSQYLDALRQNTNLDGW